MSAKITRSTDEVLAGLNDEQKKAVQRLAGEIRELYRAGAYAILPPSAGHCWLMEQAGWAWNDRLGKYEGLNA